MKRISGALIANFILIILASCNRTQPDLPANVIMPASLTAEQQDIVDLLSIPNSQEILIFTFTTEDSYRHVEVWVEAYKDGHPIERPAGVATVMDSSNARNGRIAVIVSQNDSSYQWTLSVVDNGSRTSHAGAAGISVDSGLGRAFGQMNEPVEIEDGKEIIIYSSTFQTPGVPHMAYDTQTLMERPELLTEYPYAHIVKVLFTK